MQDWEIGYQKNLMFMYLLALSSIHEQIIGCQQNATKNILVIYKMQELVLAISRTQ
jgi:hypothetical protein